MYFVFVTMLVVIVAHARGLERPCLIDDHCRNSCDSGGLQLGVCRERKCVCLHLPEKRNTNKYIIEGICQDDNECHERCAPTGMFFGRCLIDKCSCYTLMGKREGNNCVISSECPQHRCDGEFQMQAVCQQGTCSCAFLLG